MEGSGQIAWKFLVPVHIMHCHHSRSCWKLILRLVEHIIQYFHKSGVWASSEMQNTLAVTIYLLHLLYICCALEATNICDK